MKEINEYRVILFFVIVLTLHLWEKLRGQNPNRSKNKLSNLLIFVSSIALVRFAMPFGPAIFSMNIIDAQSGLFYLYELPIYYELPITILLLDMSLYWQHRLFHMIPFLWRFHKVHHADKSMDYTTGLRFHPIEILISSLYKVGVIFIINPSVIGYIIYEVLLNSMSLFNHSNIYVPKKLDQFLKYFLATPSFHTPHHSPDKKFTNSNYANFLTFWDKLFRTHTKELNEVFGLEEIKEEQAASVKEQLLLPFWR